MQILTIGNYIKIKYNGLIETISAVEARILGIEYPLPPCWMEKYKDYPITGEQADLLLAALRKRKRILERNTDTKSKNQVKYCVTAIKLLQDKFGKVLSNYARRMDAANISNVRDIIKSCIDMKQKV